MSVVSIPPRSFAFPPSARPAQPAAAAAAAAGPYDGQQRQQQYDPAVGQGSMTGMGSDEESASRAQLHQTLARMAQYMRKTRLQLPTFFVDFDRHKQGAISCAQFARVLATAGFSPLTHEVTSNLCEHYALPSDHTKVSWKSFVSDVEAIAAAQQAAAHAELQRTTQGPTLEFQQTLQDRPLQPLRQQDMSGTAGSSVVGVARAPFVTLGDIHSEHSPLTAQKLLHKIQTLCVQKRVLLNDLFADYDARRSGLITLQRFRRCLDVAGFQLTDAEANVLAGAYLVGGGGGGAPGRDEVEYRRFIADVQAPFIPAGAETAPQGVLPHFEPYRLEEHETPPARFSTEESSRLESLLRELGYQVHTRRILVRPAFGHHDHGRSGCVTARQFASVVTATFPSVRIVPGDLELLQARYRKGSVGVCYRDFIKDVEEHERKASEYARTLHPSHAAAHIESLHGVSGAPPMQPLPARGPAVVAGMRIVGTRADLERTQHEAAQRADEGEVVGRIRATLARQRLDISDIFRDFDPLNKGRVTRAQFFRALTQVGLKLSATDVHLLTERYPHAEVALDVDYKRFVADLSTSQFIETHSARANGGS